MKNIIVQLDKNEGRDKTREYFLDTCGLYRRPDINPKHITDSLSTFDEVYDHIDIKAVISRYDRSCVQGDRLVCDGVSFQCQALSRVPAEDVLDVFIYLLTTGDMKPTSERVVFQVYCDIWQTAFVDVGRDLLQDYVKSTLTYDAFAISDTFGPGFFGMPGADTEKFFQVLAADRIGASIRPGGLMIPVKSYAGFFLVTTKEESLPSKDCENCVSSRKTCSYCKSGRQRGPVAALELMKGDLLKKQHWQDSVRTAL